MKFENWYIHGFNRDDAVGLVHSGFNPLVAVILAARGITSAAQAARLLTIGLSGLYDPFLMADMDRAAARIQQAVQNRERVVVFGDYDVDGMTSSCVMSEFLRSLGLECSVYIPGRLDEGYGLNTPAIDSFAKDGVSLIVTVDCGITAVEETIYANSLGIDVIITDHHECKDTLPPAVAVVDPKRHDCQYPNKSLAGVGVAFKVVCAAAGSDRLAELMEKYGELVALGTIADVVSVRGENRSLIKLGMQQLSKTRRPGLKYLLHDTGLDAKRMTTGAIGFAIAPRLNAAGRMGHPDLSVRLLSTSDPNEAKRVSDELYSLNCERRNLVTSIFDDAVSILAREKIPGPIILSKRGWYQGVMGIVAARIAEIHMLPTIMICIDEHGIGRGSCRSFADFQLYSALEHCSDLLVNFGGHEMAAGLTIKEENIPEFTRRFQAYYHQRVKIPPVPTLHIDFEVKKPGLLSLDNLDAAAIIEPYGNGHPPPILCIKNAVLSGLVPVGGGAHTKVRISKFGETFDGIFFSKTAQELGVCTGDRVDAAFEPQINEFRGRRSVQLLLADLKYHES